MATLYDRKLLNAPTVTLSFNDPLGGLLKPSQVDLHLSNDDHYFDGVNLRGERITYSRFDTLSNETWEELTGTVVSQEWHTGSVMLRTMAHDLSVFQTLLPKEVITAAIFPTADPQQGLGRPIPIVFGTAASTNAVNDAWELPWVGDNTTSNQYDYLVGRGTFANVSVYRDTVGNKLFLVPSAEYTVNTTAYSGFTVIRFALRQRSFGGGFHRIFAAADVSGADRRFSTAINTLMSSATQGLGLTMNAASVTQAAAELDVIGGLYCDGAITEQRPAQDYLTQLLNVRGMTLTQNNLGEYVLTVDTPQTTIKGLFGHGLGQAAGGVEKEGFEGLETTPMTDAIKTLVMDYRVDRWTGKPVLSTSPRSILAYGEERRVTNQFIRNQTTADKASCYMANRLIFGDARLKFRAGQMARRLRPGDVIRYQSMQPVFDDYYVCHEIARDLTTSRIYALGWSHALYYYTAGTLPAEPGASTDTDWSRSTPTAVSGLAIAAVEVESDGQNAFSATVTLLYNVANEPWAQTYVRLRRTGATSWETVAQSIEMGNGLFTQITGLITGASYDYMVERSNIINPAMSASATLTAQVTPTDTIAPGAPTSLAIVSQHLKTIKVKWVKPADIDIKYWHYEIRTAASGGGSLVVEGDTEGPGVEWSIPLNQVAYATTRYLRIRGHDYSGNTGTYSSSLSFSLSNAVDDDISELSASKLIGQVVDSQIFAMAVAKIVGQIITSQITNNAVSVAGAYSNDSDTVPGTSETEIGTLTVSTNGGGVVVIAKCRVRHIDTGGSWVTPRIRKDSTSGENLDLTESRTLGGIESHTITLIAIDTSPAASQTYKFTATAGDTTLQVYYRRIVAFNLKK